MRCFFLRNGHVAEVEMLTGLSDQEAIAKADLLFSERSAHFDAFEVWERARMVLRHPDPFAEKRDAGQPSPIPGGLGQPHDDVVADPARASSSAGLVRNLRIEPDADEAVGTPGRQRDTLRRLDRLIRPPG
jgi:hypothetical protein